MRAAVDLPVVFRKNNRLRKRQAIIGRAHRGNITDIVLIFTVVYLQCALGVDQEADVAAVTYEGVENFFCPEPGTRRSDEPQIALMGFALDVV